MRTTNSMIQNQMLVNINRNMNRVNNYYMQAATGLRVYRASDDPIAASRALGLKTDIAETQQYAENVAQARGWMEVTESSFMNIQSILQRMNEIAVEGASDTLSFEDRQKLVAEMNSQMEQLGTELNSTFGDRYVFSGFRTDDPPIFTEDNNGSYRINQEFTIEDIRNAEVYQKFEEDGVGQLTNANIIKLAYGDVENVTLTDGAGNPISMTSKSVTDTDAYQPGPDEVYLVEETGELVIGENVLNTIKDSGGINVQYEKTGFEKGDLNPKLYFECEDINPTSDEFGMKFDMEGQDNLEYQVGLGNTINVNSLGKDIVTAGFYGDVTQIIESMSGMELSSEESLRAKYIAEGYSGEELENKVQEQLQAEKELLNISSQDAFSDLIEITQKAYDTIETELTDLGARMGRLDIVETRLADDSISYKALLQDEVGADMVEVFMGLATAETAYMASMKTGSNIIQTSLVDFI